eukprot:4570528-Amphidinium_carterae.1
MVTRLDRAVTSSANSQAIQLQQNKGENDSVVEGRLLRSSTLELSLVPPALHTRRKEEVWQLFQTEQQNKCRMIDQTGELMQKVMLALGLDPLPKAN